MALWPVAWERMSWEMKLYVDCSICVYRQISCRSMHGDPTCTVNVRVDEKGQPQYEITQHVAWDFFETHKGVAHVGRAGIGDLFRDAGTAFAYVASCNRGVFEDGTTFGNPRI